MSPDLIQPLFTRPDGSYLCARWGRPIVPVVFGVDDASLATLKGAIEVMVHHVGHKMAETDPELGANLMVFFLRGWQELRDLPELARLIPEIEPLCARLIAQEAAQYRLFRFDAGGAIKAVFVFLNMQSPLAEEAAEDLALAQAAQALLSWGEGAFARQPALARLADGQVVLHPQVSALLRAAYDPLMPAAAQDPAHAYRLAARLAKAGV